MHSDRRRARRVTVVAVAMAMLAASCGGDEPESLPAPPAPTTAPTATPAPTAVPSPTATPTPTFTIRDFDVPVSPLNGTALDDAATARRRVLAVKIDNAAEARPQSGIEQADLMVEIWVEGITRFLSLWQGSDSDYVGPIRSMRPTDFALQQSLQSTFVNSGGQEWVQAIGNASDVAWFQEPSGTFRIGSRFAPHNLYGDTEALRPLDGRGDYDEPLAPLWEFGDLPRGAERADDIFTSWPQGYNVSWQWNGTAYERTTLGAPHNYLTKRGRERRITAETIVMLEMPIVLSGQGQGTPVPESLTTGSGRAWVFHDGRYVEGTWRRRSVERWFRLLDAQGDPLPVPPGRMWLVLPPTDGVAVS
jgi:hypothetical protein